MTFSYGDETARPTGSSSPPAAGPTSRRSASTRPAWSATSSGLIKVDGALRTRADGIYAIGDIVPGPALAHKASDEGIIAVEDAAGLQTHPLEYDDIPRATFCSPTSPASGSPRSRRARPATT